MRMVEEQENMRVPEELVPYCPACGEPMSMNLRCDDTFVEDGSWHETSLRYAEFIRRTSGKKVLFLELGVGMPPRHHQVSVLENDRRKFRCVLAEHQP